MAGPKAKDYSGVRFGMLTAIARLPNPNPRVFWIFRCQCGTEKAMRLEAVKNGNTSSCGCMAHIRAVRHGDTHTHLWMCWQGMKGRCLRVKTPYYKHYGGRGISFHPSWGEYEPFRDWALANGYAHGLTLDRTNPDGNYEPENCRWVTKRENAKRNYDSQRIDSFGRFTGRIQ